MLAYDLLVVQTTTFNGSPATETSGTIVRASWQGGQPGLGDERQYSLYTGTPVDGSVSILGEHFRDGGPLADPPTSAPTDGGDGITYRYEPARALRYNLQSGTSYEQDYIVHRRYDTSAATAPADETAVHSAIQFLGKEPVTVPAGTFEACRFDETRSEDWTFGDGTVAVHTKSWIGVGNGLLIRYERDGEIYELINASIDGDPVTGR